MSTHSHIQHRRIIQIHPRTSRFDDSREFLDWLTKTVDDILVYHGADMTKTRRSGHSYEMFNRDFVVLDIVGDSLDRFIATALLIGFDGKHRMETLLRYEGYNSLNVESFNEII